jgi:hypothetical protein
LAKKIVEFLGRHLWTARIALVLKVASLTALSLLLSFALLPNFLTFTSVLNCNELATRGLLDETIFNELLHFGLDLMSLLEFGNHSVPLLLHGLHLSHSLSVFGFLLLLSQLFLCNLGLASSAFRTCLHQIACNTF